ACSRAAAAGSSPSFSPSRSSAVSGIGIGTSTSCAEYVASSLDWALDDAQKNPPAPATRSPARITPTTFRTLIIFSPARFVARSPPKLAPIALLFLAGGPFQGSPSRFPLRAAHQARIHTRTRGRRPASSRTKQ